MSPAQIQAYIALFDAAQTIGTDIYNGVKNLVAAQLTPAELAILEAAWEADVNESAKNAGIPPVPDVPLP